MGVTIRKTNSAPSFVQRRALQIGMESKKSGRSSSAILDGYLVRSIPTKSGAIVDVVDPPQILMHARPYLYQNADVSFSTSLWRTAIIPSRDPISVGGYRTLTYSVGENPDLSSSDLRYVLIAGGVGSAPDNTLTARGIYSTDGDAVCTAAILGGRGSEASLSLWRMDAAQTMLSIGQQRDGYTGPERKANNVAIPQSALGVSLYPSSFHGDYTITPGVSSLGRRSGVAYAHTFTPQSTDIGTDDLAGVVILRYEITGEYGDPDERSLSINWISSADTLGLDEPMAGSNVRLSMSSVASDGSGILVCQLHHSYEYSGGTETAWGLASIAIGDSGCGAISMLAGAAESSGDCAAYTPVCQLVGSYGAAIACHRASMPVSGGDVLDQSAEDLSLFIVSQSGMIQADLQSSHPVVYVNRDATMDDGRIKAGVWTYPVETGDWSTYLVQSCCQCGPDELAVVTRPNDQFADGHTDYRIAIVRISTGELISQGPAIAHGSLYMLTGITCMEMGLWDGSTELKPARLLMTLFREAGAPAEPPESSLPGTYRLFESGRIAECAVAYLTASLCYSLGSVIAPAKIGG